jgi:hypothetical protein
MVSGNRVITRNMIVGSFHATGITASLKNGDAGERRRDEISLDGPMTRSVQSASNVYQRPVVIRPLAETSVIEE